MCLDVTNARTQRTGCSNEHLWDSRRIITHHEGVSNSRSPPKGRRGGPENQAVRCELD